MTHNEATMERKDAIKAGMQFYETGRPCKNGHISKRDTVTGACIMCVRENNRIYQKIAREAIKNYQMT
jgi:hypothetical protein